MRYLLQKRFDGKLYKLHDRFNTKAKADESANKMKKRGYYIKVSKELANYNVWVR